MVHRHPTYTPDATALFAAGHNNTAATALSNSNLNAASGPAQAGRLR